MNRTMKIFLISDIHTEHVPGSVEPNFDDQSLKFNYPEDADVIVLAGDIGEWSNGLVWARNRFSNKEIIYVPGNHEYYDSDIAIINDMRLKANELGIHFLDKDSVTINEVRFLGTTLWTNFNNYSHEAIAQAARNMCDYEYIKCKNWWGNQENRKKALSLMTSNIDFGFGPEFFSPTVAYLLHLDAMDWLGQQLNKQHQGKTVIVTHHAPSMHSRLDNNYAYASNLETFITNNADKIDLWCHGHIHEPVDYQVAGVRIVSNPRGYPTFPISRLFDDEKTICI